ncbi:acetyl-CoA carboxylase biotin carboxylase subunit [Candidatus Marinamargulisbacteria bacterium]|nr:acetyl-CoA carboxylase biotin carboxylase subunit [Candidatus Marinamargulisbacteria bacterium]
MENQNIKKVLIANRGEIALRVIRACKELGLETVAIYSKVDANSLHVKLADEALCIGPASPAESYLNIPAIIAAAEASGAQAIHPGYGFLAENAEFVDICSENGIIFIGPSSDNIRLMGDKNQARETCRNLGIPLVPGSNGMVTSEVMAKSEAARIGYPLLIKAAAGGGGKGMRVVESEDELIPAYDMTTSEAKAAFGSGSVYFEKLIQKPRHVEIQILSDRTGHAIHIGERDCSIQRRHQKLIEESPCPVLSDAVRKQMTDAAIKIAQSIQYEGAGTVEFLLDQDQNFYFIEMNTRIQVEHPVSEMVSGINLVAQQLEIAQTKRLSIQQSGVQFYGHAMEFRINAEDPSRNFMPAPGKLDLFLPPGGFGIRVDSHVYPGYQIPPYYDSLLAKLIVWGLNREETLRRARRALNEFVIDGVPTTRDIFLDIIQHEDFKKGNVDTHFLDTAFRS